MTTKTDIIAAVQSVADASDDDGIKTSLGTPGDYVEISGLTRATGAGWDPEPKPWSVFVEGLADWLNSKSVGQLPGFRAIQNFAISGTISAGKDLAQATASGITITLPLANSVTAGTQIVVKNTAAASITIAPGGADTIDGGGSGSLGGKAALRFYSDGSSDWRKW